MNTQLHWLLTGLLVSTFVLTSVLVQAQTTGKTEKEAPVLGRHIEEVLVTATKRTESVQRIAASISAISAEELEARRVSEFFDYGTTIPNLSFGATDDGILSGRTIALRGVQGENTTGVYIDDTPLSETIDPRILDLERIEVLRGPTGTLYGARSLGGTIRQITRKPDFERFSAKIRTGIASSKESDGINYLGNFSANIPLSDRAAVIITALQEEKSGNYDRVFGNIADPFGAPTTFSNAPTRTVEDVDDESTTAARIALLWQPTESLTIEPRLMVQKVKLSGFPLADTNPDNFSQNRDVNVNAPEGGSDKWTLASLNISHTTEYGTLTSAFSYFDRSTFEFEESGAFINFILLLPGEFEGFGVPLDILAPKQLSSPIFQKLESTSYTEELRFASDLDGALNYVAGLFYQKLDRRQAYQPRNVAAGLNDILAEAGIPVSFPGDLIFTSDTPSSLKDLGIFGELSIDFTDKFSLSVGGRYYDVEVEFLDRRAGLAAGINLEPDASLNTIEPITNDKQEEDGLNLKFAAEYAATEDVLIYGQISQGFRIGGVNEFTPAGGEDPLGCLAQAAAAGLEDFNKTTYQSDKLISYEVGVKSTLGGHTRLNVAAFHIDIADIQQRFPFACGFPLTSNFGDATSQGIELELLSRPTAGLTLGVNLGLTKAKFSESFGTSFINKGDPLQQVPEFTASGSIDYFIPAVVGNADLFVRLDANYIDDSVTRTNASSNAATRSRDGYEQINLRTGLETNNWTVALYVRNLTNNIANLGDNRSLAAETPGRIRYVVSRPRTIGLDVQYQF